MNFRNLKEMLIEDIACGGCPPTNKLLRHGNPTETEGVLYISQQVIETCALALNGLGLSINDRREACRQRAADPDALLNCALLRQENTPNITQ